MCRVLETSAVGLEPAQIEPRRHRYGPNRLRPPSPPSRLRIIVRQFENPLIAVLVVASAAALALGEASDAVFIAAVLAVNATIGAFNELRAEREVRALSRLVRSMARVRRGGRVVEIDGEEIVSGDLVLLESGGRVPADLRLIETQALRIDESLLTGESVPSDKDAQPVLDPRAPLAERSNMAFGGTIVVSGRGLGLVVAVGEATEVGAIAGQLQEIRREPPPLLRRMERFARVIGWLALGLCAGLVLLGMVRGEPLAEVLLGAVALAVSAVPEGLPIALTVALAVAVSRMARRRVVVRQLPAVEALGSCSVIASDKTGTLTKNELTVERVSLANGELSVTGIGYAPEGAVLMDGRPAIPEEHPALFRLLRAASLANEGTLSRSSEEPDRWDWSGDPTDVALLALAQKAGCDPVLLREAHPRTGSLPFEPERRFAASFHADSGRGLVCVKGAPERVIEMCESALSEEGACAPIDPALWRNRTERLMQEGYRVLAVAEGRDAGPPSPGARLPSRLVLLGLVAMTDPPREGVEEALAACRSAGVRVLMVTGDHATTAAAIAGRIGLVEGEARVLGGEALEGLDDDDLTRVVPEVDVVARATPEDKLRVVEAWQARGALVAVTGDGVNDAPALRKADLGVAMGQSGTDVAREAADVVVTDDNFASIVAGIAEGRVAYDNVRKVIYLLISTGAGEVILVTGALLMGYPLPLTAVQLLWLNLVTNGIQDVALAFEKPEPGVLSRAPRPAGERIFDGLMVARTVLAGLVFGGLGLLCWILWLSPGRSLSEARNLMVQLFVLFEIAHIGNARSERISLFRLSPMRNPMLLFGTFGAVAVHGTALYVPWTQDLLGIVPPTAGEWAVLAVVASAIIGVMEAHKAWCRRGGRAGAPGEGAQTSGSPGSRRARG